MYEAFSALHNVKCCCVFTFSLLDVFSEPTRSLLCRDSTDITLNLVFEYVAQDLAQHIQVSGSTTVFSEAYIKVMVHCIPVWLLVKETFISGQHI